MRSLGKQLITRNAAWGYPLLPLTRWVRGPLRWLYHRSPYLQHDSRFHWKPNVLLGLHQLLVRDHPADFAIYDGKIRFRSTGGVMSLQGYYVGEIERHLVDFVVAQLRDGFTMIDVGAHHGVFTTIVAYELRARGWRGHVHSFEPDPGNFALLAHNVAQNDLGAYVTLHRAAVADVAGEAELVGAEGENSGNTLAQVSDFALEPDAPRVSRRVTVTTLDAMLAEVAHVDFIKLDIQGAEPLALAGGRALIERDRPVIAVEAVEGWPSSQRVRDELAARGYRIHGVTRDGRPCEVGSADAFVSWDWVALPPPR
ncbi:MAG TPA: FkbM family methyltransferase [Kofleriaceae bacterium]|nr:FkbM family methyltransferase [Kofleriaceae bacterium]